MGQILCFGRLYAFRSSSEASSIEFSFVSPDEAPRARECGEIGVGVRASSLSDGLATPFVSNVGQRSPRDPHPRVVQSCSDLFFIHCAYCLLMLHAFMLRNLAGDRDARVDLWGCESHPLDFLLLNRIRIR
jgi:hypothetical protein